jgi:peptide/nickel transport system permease protein
MSAAAAVESPFRRIAADFAESRLALAGLAVFALVLFVAIAAPWCRRRIPMTSQRSTSWIPRFPPGGQSADG